MDNDFNNSYSSISVDADTLDNMLKELEIVSFDYMSITVNGAELEVLKGAKNLIENSAHCRIYSKGHSQLDGESLNQHIKRFINEFDGYNIVLSRGEKSNSGQENWKRRSGDIFAWR